MAWVKFDDAFYRHEKRWELDLEGVGLFVLMLCFANDKLTDGFVPAKYVKSNLPKRATVASLLEAGLIEEVEGGYTIHDYLDYQPSKEQVLKLRADRAAAGKRGAAKRWGAGMATAMALAIGLYGNTHGNAPSNLDAPLPGGFRDEASGRALYEKQVATPTEKGSPVVAFPDRVSA